MFRGLQVTGLREKMPWIIIIIIIYITIVTAIQLSLGGSSPYTGADRTDENKYT